MIIHEPNQKLFLAWFDNRLILIDPPQQKVLCEFQVRFHHNGRELPSPEIALPEVNETPGAADAGFIKPPLAIPQQNNGAGSE